MHKPKTNSITQKENKTNIGKNKSINLQAKNFPENPREHNGTERDIEGVGQDMS